MACEALMPPNCKSLYLFRFDVHSPLMHGAWYGIMLYVMCTSSTGV